MKGLEYDPTIIRERPEKEGEMTDNLEPSNIDSGYSSASTDKEPYGYRLQIDPGVEVSYDEKKELWKVVYWPNKKYLASLYASVSYYETEETALAVAENKILLFLNKHYKENTENCLLKAPLSGDFA